MTIRKITILIGFIILAGSIILFNILSKGPNEEVLPLAGASISIGVPVIEAKPASISSEIYFTGRVIPKDRLELFAEVTGTLSRGTNSFKAGTKFKKGDTLLKIDDREQKQAVLNQKSQFLSLITQILADINIDYPEEYDAWNSYLNDMDINVDLEPLPTSDNRSFNLFLTGRGINSSYFAIKQSEVRLSKYSISAPYDGVLTESSIDPGTLVRQSQRIGEFIRIGSYEIEASINANDRFFINTGDVVSVILDGNQPNPISAKVARINSKIDPSTQTILIYLDANDGNILSGQYVSGIITGKRFSNAQKIASKSLVRNNKVFVSRDSVATILTIEVLAKTRDSLIIQGLELGDLVIDEFRDAAFEGTKVVPLKN
ncbi:MAG: HlyD family efflux transporter periplasmic adaptor subunit [Balneolaceae bacterium]